MFGRAVNYCMSEIELDQIGRWSEIKLEIIREYAKPYSQILAKQPSLYHMYIDGFAGAGMHISKSSGLVVSGSPLNVTAITPKFREYHLVELDNAKAKHLRHLFENDHNVKVHEGDCNTVLPASILPNVRYEQFRRAFCLLDPYGLHVDWNVFAIAGKLKTIDLLLNFPIMDMNMNVLWHDPSAVSPGQSQRMTRFWGDESWKNAAYRQEQILFGPVDVKAGNDAVANAFAKRLKTVAGFKFVAEPLPMVNTSQATVYYLIFASQNATAHKIISQIFKKRRNSMKGR